MYLIAVVFIRKSASTEGNVGGKALEDVWPKILVVQESRQVQKEIRAIPA